MKYVGIASFVLLSGFLPAEEVDPTKGLMPTVYVVDLEPTPKAAKTAMSGQYVLDTCHTGSWRLYLKEGELKQIEKKGLPYTLVEVQPNPPDFDDGQKQLGQYHSYAELTAALQDFAANYPAICRVSSIGSSVQGRSLWRVCITDNPDVQEDEPEFKYISSMHGDEVVGVEMCLYFIDTLLRNYGQDTPEGQRVTRLVNETDIAIMPLMNPDGHFLGSRFNANGTDLNRDFPSYVLEGADGRIFDGAPLSDSGREPETQLVMQWTASNSFVASANFHGGALVVNYPFDEGDAPVATYDECPDDALFVDVSKRYSIYNTPMWNSPTFPMGITNGSDWYTVYGGMQDWNYRYVSCNDVTIELSDLKRPPEPQIPTFWSQNKESMFSYLEAVHIGVRGRVTAQGTGAPLYAKIEVGEIDQPVYTDPQVGDYHRMLLPGTYNVTVSAPGFIPQTFSDVLVVGGDALRIDAALVLEGSEEGEGEGEGSPLPEVFHTTDYNEDGRFELREILRLIQLFNSPSFGCASGTDDGFGVNSADHDCQPHNSDYNPQNWDLNLSEVLRAVQIFHALYYTNCPGSSQDGFCAIF